MLQRWNPVNEIERMWDEMDRVLTDSFVRPRTAARAWTFRPAIDVYDSGEQVVVRAILPGATSEDIDLTIEQNTLTLRGRFGHTASDESHSDVTWYRREIGSGQFAESFTLPVPVDAENATASFENGILTLTLPKAEQARTRRIPVQAPQALTAE